ncbi:MAG: hypothetical protein AAF541_08615 [Pseudomonadota bacterium]
MSTGNKVKGNRGKGNKAKATPQGRGTRGKSKKAAREASGSADTELADDEVLDEAGETEDVDEFAEQDAEVDGPDQLNEDAIEEELDDFDGEVDGDEEDIDAVVALSAKEQSARNLEVRRAIEERMDKRRLDEDLDYLDLEFDD